ncbi:MAG: hypothetical protein ACWGO1_00690, partial [Anaerolineales bacterium]
MLQHWKIKYVLYSTVLSLLVFFAVACSAASVPNTGGEVTPEDLPPQAVMEAVNQLSQELNVSIEQIKVVEFEQVDWPDACLGLAQEDQVCAQVVTPGFRSVL